MRPDEKQAVTIGDVAKAAGVSISTVSRILNNKTDVANKTRERVLQVIEELGYRPLAQAQSLRAKTSRTIALLYPEVIVEHSAVGAGFVFGASNAAAEANFLFNLVTKPVDETELINLYLNGHVGGTILLDGKIDDWRVNLLRDRELPFVSIGRTHDNSGVSYVSLDQESGVFAVFEYLVGLDHTKIGFITYPEHMRIDQHGVAIRCLEGYDRAIDAFGLAPMIREVEQNAEAVYAGTRDMLSSVSGVTALVVTYGSAVTGALRALQEYSLHVPEDCSVVAFLAHNMAELITPAMTRIEIPTYEMGYQAAKILVKQLQWQGYEPLDVEQVLIKPELLIRDSTGEAKAIRDPD